MKFTNEVVVNSNITFVANKVIDPDFLKICAGSNATFEVVSPLNNVGGKVQVFHDFRGKKFLQEIETLRIDLPSSLVTKSTMSGTTFVEESSFKADGGKTIWTVTTNYKFSFFMNIFVKMFRKKAFELDSKNMLEQRKKILEEL
ncbi:MAG: SRPBCC family protein [Lachnospirales bacterium]